MTSSSFELQGVAKIEARIKEIDRNIRSKMDKKALGVAEKTRAKAKEYCPMDEGTLEDSIEVVKANVEQSRDSGGRFTSGASVSYAVIAGNENTPHALAVHENPSQHDPPTWEGVDVKFKKGGPKFLERAAREHEREFYDEMENALKES
jgi:hypothetical protein